jgi:probable HAF family extracellular repeat protein
VRIKIGAGALLALCLWSPGSGAAPARAHRYRVVDVGTLGGAQSQLINFDQANTTLAPFNDAGQLAVISLTASGNSAAALWSRDALWALPNLPNANAGGGGSFAYGINARGVVVGGADDGVINPRNGHPYDHAVRWDESGIVRLPELDGHASWANFITDAGIIVGYANNGVADPYAYARLQNRAVLWRGGVLEQLGTLGGSNSAALAANRCHDACARERLVVIGTSSLDNQPSPPFGLPATDAFVWSDGVMTDLGGLGGGFSIPTAVNCRGEVSVIAFDASNQHYQSFVWSDGHRRLLTPLGGHFVEANTLNDDGVAVGGVSDASDQNSLAAVWDGAGQGRLIGVVGGDTGSMAFGINSRGVVVGGSGNVPFTGATASYAHAFVAGADGGIADLNTLVGAGSPLALHVAYAINERGEIAGLGTNAAGETHAFILVPDEHGYDDNAPAPVSSARVGRTLETSGFRPLTDGLRRSGIHARDDR